MIQMKHKEKILKEIEKKFDDDLKKKINPLFDISTTEHEGNMEDLKELFVAVGNYAYDEAMKQNSKEC